ncbi:unnamed protein product [Didymodactylos carnosus]|uniref:Retrotransposon gag domain-containing protein n=1 Tax=Didymodactylos carnosus TaxID=1234261 RepID=A0A815X4A6_9BILA|nr:unnamed protein product [Didymodactylos carnosus]CAF4413790.1 unnamed protein product [Didymodactylos carnosus]
MNKGTRSQINLSNRKIQDIQWQPTPRKQNRNITLTHHETTGTLYDLSQQSIQLPQQNTNFLQSIMSENQVEQDMKQLLELKEYQKIIEEKYLQKIPVLKGIAEENLEEWFYVIEQIFTKLLYPQTNWICTAILFLDPSLRMQWYETIKAQINYNEWSTFKDQLQQYFANKFTLPEQGAQISIISEPKENVVTWLEQVEQQFALAEWSNETKLKYVSNQLKEDALVWFNEQKDMFTS